MHVRSVVLTVRAVLTFLEYAKYAFLTKSKINLILNPAPRVFTRWDQLGVLLSV